MSLSREVATAAARHAIVTIQGLNVVFESMTGGGVSVDTGSEFDPFTGRMEDTAATATWDPIVLATSLAPHRDLTWLRQIKRRVGTGVFTIVRQWTDANWDPVGEAEVYPDCLLIGYTNPESSPSADDVTFALTFSTTGEAL